jgi:hypothetical protein
VQRVPMKQKKKPYTRATWSIRQGQRKGRLDFA